MWTQWLEWAFELQGILEKEFKAKDGAFYHTSTKEDILIRKCEFYDGSEPSGNGVEAEILLRFFQLTQDEKYLDQVEDIFKAAKTYIETYPPGSCYHLLALHRYFDPKSPTVVVALDEFNHMKQQIQDELAIPVRIWSWYGKEQKKRK